MTSVEPAGLRAAGEEPDRALDDARFRARLRLAGYGGWVFASLSLLLLGHGLHGVYRVHTERLMGSIRAVWIGAELMVAGALVLAAAAVLWLTSYAHWSLAARRLQRAASAALAALVAGSAVAAMWVHVSAHGWP